MSELAVSPDILIDEDDIEDMVDVSIQTENAINNLNRPPLPSYWFFHFFTVYILNNVFCKYQVIPAENDCGICYFPLCCPKYNFWDKPI